MASADAAPGQGDEALPPVVDTQIHVWTAAWPDIPAGEPTSFTSDDAAVLMDAAGVERAVLVPPRWAGFGNAEALAAAEARPDRFSVLGRFDPTAPDAGTRLAGWSQQPSLVGLRLVLSHPPAPRWIRSGLFRSEQAWFWSVVSGEEIPVTVFAAHLLPELTVITRDHPDLILIIDHCGATAQKTDDSFAALPDLLAMADRPNVYVKLSSLPAYSDRPYPYEDLDHVVREVVGAFGAERCMWGSDITRFGGKATYGDLLDHLRQACSFLSDDERAWILGRTAAVVYGLGRSAALDQKGP